MTIQIWTSLNLCRRRISKTSVWIKGELHINTMITPIELIISCFSVCESRLEKTHTQSSVSTSPLRLWMKACPITPGCSLNIADMPTPWQMRIGVASKRNQHHSLSTSRLVITPYQISSNLTQLHIITEQSHHLTLFLLIHPTQTLKRTHRVVYKHPFTVTPHCHHSQSSYMSIYCTVYTLVSTKSSFLTQQILLAVLSAALNFHHW